MTKQAGFPDKTPTSNPPIEVDGYESMGTKTRPPAAAKFGVGSTSLPEIQDATDRRRAHSDALSKDDHTGWPAQSRDS
jgi:hypothetical protein